MPDYEEKRGYPKKAKKKRVISTIEILSNHRKKNRCSLPGLRNWDGKALKTKDYWRLRAHTKLSAALRALRREKGS